MKALKLYGIRDIRYEEAEEPQIVKDTDVKIRVKAAGICGSDISRYSKLGPYVAGMIWGHEFSGEVAEVGKAVRNFRPGSRVTASPALYCGVCEPCRGGRFAQCEHLDVIGAHKPGAFAEYVVLPEHHVISLPDVVSFEAGAMVEPTSVVAHGFYKTSFNPGETVAVIGCGSIGLLAIQWAKVFGAGMVIALDIDDRKLNMAEESGADVVINTRGIDPGEAVKLANGGKGADLAIEAAGTPITSAQVFDLPGKGGKVLFLGIPYGDVMVKRAYFECIVRKELTVYGSWNAVSAPYPGREWISSVHFMATKQLDPERIITHRIPMSEGSDAFELTAIRREHFGKILLIP